MNDFARFLAVVIWVVLLAAGGVVLLGFAVTRLGDALKPARVGSIKALRRFKIRFLEALNRFVSWPLDYEPEYRKRKIRGEKMTLGDLWRGAIYLVSLAAPVVVFVFAVIFVLAFGLHIWISHFGPISWLS